MWLLRFQSFCCALRGFALCSLSSSDSAQAFSPDHPGIDPTQVLFERSPPLIAQTMRKWLSKVARWLSACRGVSQCICICGTCIGHVFLLKVSITWRPSVLRICKKAWTWIFLAAKLWILYYAIYNRTVLIKVIKGHVVWDIDRDPEHCLVRCLYGTVSTVKGFSLGAQMNYRLAFNLRFYWKLAQTNESKQIPLTDTEFDPEEVKIYPSPWHNSTVFFSDHHSNDLRFCYSFSQNIFEYFLNTSALDHIYYNSFLQLCCILCSKHGHLTHFVVYL